MTDLTNDSPTGLPPAGDTSEDPQPRSGGDVIEGRDEGASIADRLGRNPGNLGDDVTDMGDMTHPDPEPKLPQM